MPYTHGQRHVFLSLRRRPGVVSRPLAPEAPPFMEAKGSVSVWGPAFPGKSLLESTDTGATIPDGFYLLRVCLVVLFCWSQCPTVSSWPPANRHPPAAAFWMRMHSLRLWKQRTVWQYGSSLLPHGSQDWPMISYRASTFNLLCYLSDLSPASFYVILL